jgi:hydrogenase-4 component B
LAAGAVTTLLFSRWARLAGWMAVVFVLVALCFCIGMAAQLSVEGAPLEGTLAHVPFFGSSVSLYVDHLSLILLFVVLFVGLWAAMFSVEYLPKVAKEEGAAAFYPPLMLFLLGMCAVVSVSDVLCFLVAWEFMSLPAYLLVIYERHRPENLRAGLKYFILTHIGNLGMFVAALILYREAGSFAFGDMQVALGRMAETQPVLVNLVLALFALAFATKAGLFPTGDWLPDAHPAAPSSVSALLSGVMIKMGPYGILRVFFWLLTADAVPQGWLVAWGLVLATWGAASILLGSSAAVVCNDSKRLLAYSSISQSGYIFLGIGTALVALPTAPGLVALALIASMFHIVADAAHKSALFLTAGSVLYRAGTRDMNQLGGLESRMPMTTLAALGGTLSLAGLPFTGAFVSKWLLVQTALWVGLKHPLLLAYAIIALLGSVLAVGYGLKYAGAIFLGPESRLVASIEENEVPSSMHVAQAVLTICCFLIGLAPVLLIEQIIQALPGALEQAGMKAFGDLSLLQLVPAGQGYPGAAYAPALLAGLFVVGMIGAWLWSRSGAAPVREVAGWVCGEELAPDEVRPRASGYFWAVSHFLARVYPQMGLPRITIAERPSAALDVDRWGFGRVAGWCRTLADEVGRWHSGLTQHYVLWQVVGLLVVAIVVLAMAR